MTDGQIFALLWGSFAIAFGSMFVIKREAISRVARRQREQRGIRIGPNTQSPALMAVGGMFIVCVGIGITIAAVAGAIR